MPHKRSNPRMGPQSNPNDPLHDIVIPVMGPTGSGKSTFINDILGRNHMVVGHDQDSCTTSIATAAVDSSKFPFHQCLQNRRLVLVDTPGFDSTDWDDWQILEKIAKWLEDSYRDNLLLGGVIYLQDISLDRVPGATKRCLDMFNKACGVDALDKVVLGTTKWGRLHPDEAAKRLRRLEEEHWKDMINMGAQVFRIDQGGFSQAQKLVNAILERFDTAGFDTAGVVLEIQRELVDDKKPLSKTRAGRQGLSYMSRWKRFLSRILPFEF